MAVLSKKKQEEGPSEAAGVQYALGLVLASDETEHYVWQDDAACHGVWDVFDLPEKPNGKPDVPKYRYHLKAARPICFECPVFQQCWDSAYDNLSHGVIQAGALLGSDLGAKRKKRLVIAYDMYLEYHGRKRRARSDKRRGPDSSVRSVGAAAQ